MHIFMDYSIYVKNVCLNLQRFLEVVYTYLILKICSQSNSVQATGFSLTLKIWSQKPLETVSEMKI